MIGNLLILLTVITAGTVAGAFAKDLLAGRARVPVRTRDQIWPASVESE